MVGDLKNGSKLIIAYRKLRNSIPKHRFGVVFMLKQMDERTLNFQATFTCAIAQKGNLAFDFLLC